MFPWYLYNRAAEPVAHLPALSCLCCLVHTIIKLKRIVFPTAQVIVKTVAIEAQ